MISRASIRRHPIHPMLVVFPMAFWIGSFVCDLIYHLGSQNSFWKDMAYYAILGGIGGAFLAAVPGLMDYSRIGEGRTRRVATTHMTLNVLAIVLFIFNLGLRFDGRQTVEAFSLMLSIAGIAVIAISGWLGGSLVYTHHVGVTPAAEIPPTRRDRAA